MAFQNQWLCESETEERRWAFNKAHNMILMLMWTYHIRVRTCDDLTFIILMCCALLMWRKIKIKEKSKIKYGEKRNVKEEENSYKWQERKNKNTRKSFEMKEIISEIRFNINTYRVISVRTRTFRAIIT